MCSNLEWNWNRLALDSSIYIEAFKGKSVIFRCLHEPVSYTISYTNFIFIFIYFLSGTPLNMECRYQIQNCRWSLFVITFIALFFFVMNRFPSSFLPASVGLQWISGLKWWWVGGWMDMFVVESVCVREWNAGPARQQPHHCSKLLPCLINTLMLKSSLLSSQTLLTLLSEHMHTDTQTLGD